MLNKVINKFEKVKYKQCNKHLYYKTKDRIEYAVMFKYFLSLRPTIKKYVFENYLSQSRDELSTSIVKYEGYGFFEFENFDIWDFDLQPLIGWYVDKTVKIIESNTLKLEL